MTPAQKDAVMNMPRGYQHMVVAISCTKAVLSYPMKAGERLKVLERLNRLMDATITAETVEMIEPMPDVGMQIFAEARTLDREDKTDQHSFQLLTDPNVFELLLSVNPSLLAAIERCHRWGHASEPEPETFSSSAAPIPQPIPQPKPREWEWEWSPTFSPVRV
jgi:hypothetical protein